MHRPSGQDLVLNPGPRPADHQDVTQRRELLEGVERQLLALVALPGHPVGASSLAGPRHLYRLLWQLLRDGDPEPQVGLDGDGDVQCRWEVTGVEVVLVVDDGGSGWLWAHDADGAEVAYEEWRPAEEPHAALAAAAALLRPGAPVAPTAHVSTGVSPDVHTDVRPDRSLDLTR